MDLVNATRLVAGYTVGLDAAGRESLVVVVKGTFRIPEEQGAPLYPHEEQEPLVMSDVFFGEPSSSAPKYEVDFAPVKHRCDVILNGSAYAPSGRPAERVQVGIQIGSWSKSFVVVGDREWDMRATVQSTVPQPFAMMPISYERAFGGVDAHHEDPAQHVTYMRNPCGRGFHKHLRPAWLNGSPLPNTEEVGKPVTKPGGQYQPMSFGSLGRSWEPRYKLGGTYDKHWLDKIFPFLPADFDERYYQAAPQDQQLPLPLEQHAVTLFNLTPEGRTTFVLPRSAAPIHVFPRLGEREDCTPFVDTIVIEPDAGRVLLTWRASRPLSRNMFEVEQVLVGRKPPAWWRAHELGKTHYATLADAVRGVGVGAPSEDE